MFIDRTLSVLWSVKNGKCTIYLNPDDPVLPDVARRYPQAGIQFVLGMNGEEVSRQAVSKSPLFPVRSLDTIFRP